MPQVRGQERQGEDPQGEHAGQGGGSAYRVPEVKDQIGQQGPNQLQTEYDRQGRDNGLF